LTISRPYEGSKPPRDDGPRINELIKTPQFRLIDANGENVGIVSREQGLKLAIEAGLDLVEISPDADPPVCKIVDYGKYKYEAQKKQADMRKKQKIIEIKEIKLRPMIEENDYQVKLRSMQRFFEEGNKVKLTLRFRGREMRHQELGAKILDRVCKDVEEIAKIEFQPKFEGKQIVMVLAPK
jgi:translation initiation factor IF-3